MRPEGDPLSERITSLEEAAAHQARTIEDLSSQLADQWKIIDQLQLRLTQLTERFQSLEDVAFEAAPVTRPPHY
ncbi:SlyX family protein [Rhizobium alvei]|uniref:Protein SlyX homolog n=1 Tax=Rhizobium alvei TaxID=1132659 RepID=A0ABT8YR30_9HYPH|nr:SlyX family protein [Rhizobium alvei]MDO6966193.1 SlyX family protein [Rhizobium alvei]